MPLNPIAQEIINAFPVNEVSELTPDDFRLTVDEGAAAVEREDVDAIEGMQCFNMSQIRIQSEWIRTNRFAGRDGGVPKWCGDERDDGREFNDYGRHCEFAG